MPLEIDGCHLCPLWVWGWDAGSSLADTLALGPRGHDGIARDSGCSGPRAGIRRNTVSAETASHAAPRPWLRGGLGAGPGSAPPPSREGLGTRPPG